MGVIDLELYHVFFTVAQEGSISRAAGFLYMGQPSVSKAIRRLEDLLGVRLFERGSRGVTLTPSGTVLLEHVSRAVEELNAGELAVRQWNETAKEELSIGVGQMLYQHLIGPHVKPFYDNHAGLTLNIIDYSLSLQIIEAVRDGSLDLGIVSRPLELCGLSFSPLAPVEEILIAEPRYLARLNTSSAPALFQDATLIFLEPGNVARAYNEQYLESLGVSVKPEITTSNMNYIIALVEAGIGLGIVYREAVREQLGRGSLVELSFLPPVPAREIGIIQKKGRPPTYAMHRFIEYYQTVFMAQRKNI